MNLLSNEEKQEAKKRLNLFMEKLQVGALFVEGKKDKRAMQELGFTEIYTISGNLRESCEKAAKSGVSFAILLTDLDQRGDELANEAREELGRYGIKCDSELRKNLAGLLKFRNFEEMKRKYDKFVEEISI